MKILNIIKKVILIITSLLFIFPLLAKGAPDNIVEIIVPDNASHLVQLVADDLVSYMTKMYPGWEFQKGTEPTSLNHRVYVGKADNLKKTGVDFDHTLLSGIESFSISVNTKNNQTTCIIAGVDGRGTLNAVYALLDKLGCGFFISYETVPSYEKLSFDDWQLNDSPAVGDRIVFNWHNFLSGCTGWSLPDWKQWIDNSSKMRFNTIMVHAYGNNPMFQFEFNGKRKPIGYMNTSASGRDWGAQHVNDVRLLPGGEIFKGPIIGSDAAIVPDEIRGDAAVDLMQDVFKHAEKRGMNVIYAHDIDTESANPQELILTLPSSARFKAGKFWLANPETPEGYEFYKTQAKTLLETYPEIDKLALWVRWSASSTPWRKIRKGQLPEKWKNEYYDLLAEQWKILDDDRSVSTFALSKVVKAYQKALNELEYGHVEVIYGSWGWDDMVPSNYIIPKDVTFMPLDWWINFEFKATEMKLAEIARNRKLIPIVWAHHDDHRYIGKPYTPFSNFADLLKKRGASGYGIIHWTTFPLDLYFSSLSRQVWNNSRNETLDTTLKNFVLKNWGEENEILIDYFNLWLADGPMFGRETSNHFMDIGGSFLGKDEFEDPQSIIDKSHKRLKVIRQLDKRKITQNLSMLDYFEKTELFYISFFQNQQRFSSAFDFLSNNNISKAKDALSKLNIEETLELYAENLEIGPGTTSEKAVLFSMGTRWFPDFINIKQRAGMEPVRYKFGQTNHDPLAQQKGKYTWFIDKDKKLWSVLGHKELGVGEFKTDSQDRSYLSTNSPVELSVLTISGNSLPEGKYTVKIICETDEKDSLDIYVVDSQNEYLADYTSTKQGSSDQLSFELTIKDIKQPVIRINPRKNISLYNLYIERK